MKFALLLNATKFIYRRRALDDDLQNPLEEMPRLLEKLEERYIVVNGKCHHELKNRV